MESSCNQRSDELSAKAMMEYTVVLSSQYEKAKNSEVPSSVPSVFNAAAAAVNTVNDVDTAA